MRMIINSDLEVVLKTMLNQKLLCIVEAVTGETVNIERIMKFHCIITQNIL